MTSSQSKIGKLEEEALKRREKLKNLKRKRDGNPNENNTSNAKEDESEGQSLPKPVFRSYKPLDDEMEEFIAEPARPGDVTAEIKDQLESAKSEMVIDQLDVTSLAPRKPDWDLKRDVAKRLEKLERQTQKAIAELIRERLKERSKNEDLAALVNLGPSGSNS